MKDLIPGWKTNITTVLLAFIPIAGLFGYQIDPEAVTNFVNNFAGWLQGGITLLGGLGIWFRQLAKR